MTVYFLKHGLLKKEFVGTAAWFFFVINICKIPLYCGLHVVTPQTVRFGTIVAPLAAVGGLMGVLVLAYIPQRFFDFLALTLAGLAAVRLVVA